jgi:uncharacterized protein (TIRG00374 family)
MEAHGKAPREVPPAPDVPLASKRANRVRLRRLVFVVGYAAIAVWALRATNPERCLAEIRRIELADLALVLVLVLVHLGLRAARYHTLALKTRPVGFRFLDGVRVFLLGLIASLVTPARSGDLIKAEFLRVHGVRRAAGLGIVLIERILDLLVIAGTMVVAGALLARQLESASLRVAALALLSALVVGTACVTVRSLRAVAVRIAASVLGTIPRFPVSRFVDVANVLFEVWDEIFRSPGMLARYLVTTTVMWLADFVKLYLVLRAMGVPVGVAPILFAYPVSLVAAVISLLPIGEGVVGVTAVALLGAVADVETDTAVAAVLVDRCLSTLTPIVCYGALALTRRRNNRPSDENVQTG